MLAYCGRCGDMIDVPLGKPRICPTCAAKPPEPKPEPAPTTEESDRAQTES